METEKNWPERKLENQESGGIAAQQDESFKKKVVVNEVYTLQRAQIR